MKKNDFISDNKMFKIMKCDCCGELFWRRASEFDRSFNNFLKLHKTDKYNPFLEEIEKKSWILFLKDMGEKRTDKLKNTKRAVKCITKHGSEKVYRTFYINGYSDGYMKAIQEYSKPEKRRYKTIDGQQALEMLKEICPECKKEIISKSDKKLCSQIELKGEV